jgi:hypothetical protein
MKKSTNGIIANALGYTGIVTLSRYTGSRKIELARVYNEGGLALFNYLANCLAGEYDLASSDSPIKILLLNKSEDGTLTKAPNSSFIYLLTKPEKVYSASAGVVRYSFIIPQDMIIGTDFNAIGLYTASATEADINDFAACCTINFNRNNLALSSVLVLDWELHIANSTIN